MLGLNRSYRREEKQFAGSFAESGVSAAQGPGRTVCGMCLGL